MTVDKYRERLAGPAKYEEALAEALFPFIYTRYPMRWGWLESTEEMKNECRRQASILIKEIERKS